jgi:hypothetical protein
MQNKYEMILRNAPDPKPRPRPKLYICGGTDYQKPPAEPQKRGRGGKGKGGGAA